MWTILWLVISSFIGFEFSVHFASESNPLIGTSMGFGIGGIIRIAIATGITGFIGDIFEIIGDIFEIIGECLSGIGN